MEREEKAAKDAEEKLKEEKLKKEREADAALRKKEQEELAK